MAAVHSMEEFARTANLPFNAGPTLNNGSAIHVDGAKVHGKVFHERMQRQGFKIHVASPCKKLTNYMCVVETQRMHRTVQAAARAHIKSAAATLRAEGLSRTNFHDLAMMHSADVKNWCPSNHFKGGCPVAELLGHEPSHEETMAAVPACWGSCCFPVVPVEANRDQKQLGDRREPASCLRTLQDGRHLCWRLDRQSGHERRIKTKDLVFSWGALIWEPALRLEDDSVAMD